MEARNPENELPDGRLLSQKIKEDGNEPVAEESKQGVYEEASEDKETKEESKENEPKELESKVGQLLRELDGFEYRTLDELRRLRASICSMDGGGY